MLCAFFTLLMLVGGVGVLVWFGWRRVAGHLNKTPGAKHYFVEHVVTGCDSRTLVENGGRSGKL
jgi:hypothetical protein